MRLFQHVDATQEGTLAGAGRADDADHVAGVGGQRDAFEHLVAAVALVQVDDVQFGVAISGGADGEIMF